jgi:hypothetical protein
LSPGRRTNRKNSERVKERLSFYAFYFQSQSKLRDFIRRNFKRVQAVHKPVTGFSAGGKAQMLAEPASSADFAEFPAGKPRLILDNWFLRM